MQQTWTDLVEHQAHLRPTAIAVSDHRGHRSTFAQLAHAVATTAVSWHEVGLQPGQRVVMLARNSAELLINILGVARLGAVPVLLNWRLPGDELSELVKLTTPHAALADAELAPSLSDLLPAAAPRVALHGEPPAGWRSPSPAGATTRAAVADLPSPQVRPESVFVLLHTSGTTGRPKLIPLSYRGQVQGSLRNVELAAMGPGAVHLRFAPLFHLAGLHAALMPLASGGRAHLLDGFDPDRWLDLVDELRASFVNLPPAAMLRVLDAYDARATKPDLSSLQEMNYGTAPMSEALLRRALETFTCGLRQNYGMTEAQSPVAQLTPEDHRERLDKLTSAGRPLPEWELRFVDRAGRTVDPGRGGELALRGATLFDGYWHDREATELVTLDGGWYRTGDVGRLDAEGYLHLFDRAKDMVVSGGENIYPAQVEAVLGTHPDVAEVAVIAVPSQRWGEAVHAVVVARPGATVTSAEVIDWCREHLAHFKCPSSVEFLDELPRTATGKVRKNVLRRPHWAGQGRGIS